MEEKKPFLLRLLNKDVAGENESNQFYVMMRIYYLILVFYSVAFNLVLICTGKMTTVPYLLIWIPIYMAGIVTTYFFSSRIVFHFFAISLMSWIVVAVRMLGWGYGAQSFLYPLLVVSFFATYGNHVIKGFYTAFLCIFRLLLFLYTQNFEPLIDVSGNVGIVIQVSNTVIIFISLFIICLVFSNTRQGAVHKLSVNNEKLKQEAETDALTGLMNRRSMYKELDKCIHDKNGENFVIALGDIDFFKKVNDTLGHNFGDQVLVTLSAYFRTYMEDKGIVCRWGGEEFLFLFPNMNGDEAFMYVQNMKSRIEKLDITYKDETTRVTMTFGVEEFDYKSDATALVKMADEKLYMGKENGRNQVVF